MEQSVLYIINGKLYIPEQLFKKGRKLVEVGIYWDQLLKGIKENCILEIPGYDIVRRRPKTKKEAVYYKKIIEINETKFNCFVLPIHWIDHLEETNPSLYQLCKTYLPKIIDTRVSGVEFKNSLKEFKSSTQLYPTQLHILQQILDELNKSKGTVAVAQTGRGKTVIGCSVIETLKTKTLIVTHRNDIIDIWKNALDSYFNGSYNTDDVLPRVLISVYYKGIDIDKYDIIIATYHGIITNPTNWDNQVGLLLIDEVHHVAAKYLSLVTQKVNCLTLGLTATPDRSDNRTNFIFWTIGKCCYREDAQFVLPATFHVINIKIENQYRIHKSVSKLSDHAMLKFISEDEERNKYIAHLCMSEENINKHILVFVEYVKHARSICSLIPGSQTFTGEDFPKISNSQKKLGYNFCKHPMARVIIATYRMFGEGLNNPELQVIILAHPKPSVIQPIGRGVRESRVLQNKTVDVYYLVDTCWNSCKKKYFQASSYIESAFIDLRKIESDHVIKNPVYYLENPDFIDQSFENVNNEYDKDGTLLIF